MDVSTRKARGLQAPRSRTRYGYSRTGCARCKQQRVRCDERHPECERCVRVGVKCPGFEPKLRWSTKHEIFHADPAAGPGPTRRRRGRPPSVVSVASSDEPTQQQQQSRPQTAEEPEKPQTEKPRPRAPSQPAVSPPPSIPEETPGTAAHEWNPAWLNLFDQLSTPLPEPQDLFASLERPSPATVARASAFGDPQLSLGDGWEEFAPSAAAVPGPGPGPVAEDMGTVVSDVSSDSTSPVSLAPSMPMPTLSFMAAPSPHADSMDAVVRRAWPRRLPSAALDAQLVPMTNTWTDGWPERAAGGDDQEPAAFSVFPAVPLPSPSTKVINDLGSVLVEFYFREAAQVYSCYDSRMNPFRTTVVRLWDSSQIIYRTAQSMAAAFLVRDFPQVAPVGRQLRREAIQLLSKVTTLDTNSMLAILMIGCTSGWHDSRDLGLPFFNKIAECLAAAAPPVASDSSSTDSRNYQFFYESMLYWEMLLAFVADGDSLTPFPDKPRRAEAEAEGSLGDLGIRASQKRLTQAGRPEREQQQPAAPHPWTGFAGETHRLMKQVGRLIRRQRKFDNAHRFASMAHISQLAHDMETARALERELVAIAHPSEFAVRDTEDRNTPVWHLLTLAEVIRAAGLIQLYHVFPDLLSARLTKERAAAGAGGGGSAHVSPRECSQWLTSYAVRTLDMLKTIPLDSGTRGFQPFVLVTLCSELRRAPPAGGDGMGGGDGLDGWASLGRVDMAAVEVMRARNFVQSRMTSFLHILPPKPVTVCLDIIRETWAQMDRQAEARAVGRRSRDAGDADVFWVDVMIENGWETIMA